MSDDPARARVDGKLSVAANTVWDLRIGQFCVRCVREEALLIVQAKYYTDSSYKRISSGTDAKSLLDKILSTKGLEAVLTERQKLVCAR